MNWPDWESGGTDRQKELRIDEEVNKQETEQFSITPTTLSIYKSTVGQPPLIMSTVQIFKIQGYNDQN